MPASCVRYLGCTQRPVVWCETNAAHDPMGAIAPPAAWTFFRTLP